MKRQPRRLPIDELGGILPSREDDESFALRIEVALRPEDPHAFVFIFHEYETLVPRQTDRTSDDVHLLLLCEQLEWELIFRNAVSDRDGYGGTY